MCNVIKQEMICFFTQILINISDNNQYLHYLWFTDEFFVCVLCVGLFVDKTEHHGDFDEEQTQGELI